MKKRLHHLGGHIRHYLFFYASAAITVPLASLMKTVLLVLILPMALGALTRWVLIRKRGQAVIALIKPALGLIPASTMLLVMGLIFFSKGEMLAHEWRALLPLLGATLVFLVVILADGLRSILEHSIQERDLLHAQIAH